MLVDIMLDAVGAVVGALVTLMLLLLARKSLSQGLVFEIELAFGHDCISVNSFSSGFMIRPNSFAFSSTGVNVAIERMRFRRIRFYRCDVVLAGQKLTSFPSWSSYDKQLEIVHV